MRRMSEEAGEPLEPEMEEAVGRLERGEDPEAVMAGLDETFDAADAADDEF
jgi:Flp pilus assembly protein TadB